MRRLSSVIIEADPRYQTGYALCMDDYREDFVEGRDRFRSVTSFRFIGVHGEYLARQEYRGGHVYWYGFKRLRTRLYKVYLGSHHRMTLQRLEDAAIRLHDYYVTQSVAGDHRVTQANYWTG